MTLCVAIKVPAKALNPVRRPFEFREPGIVIASDSRYSWRSGHRTEDDGLKLCPLSDWAIAGFSGDVALATNALFSASESVSRNALTDPESVAQETQKDLLRYRKRIARWREIEETEVLLGTHDIGSDRPLLYLLSSTDGFNPSPRDGIWSIGSGRIGFGSTLGGQIEYFSRQWSNPAILEPRSKDNLVIVQTLEVAILLLESLNRHMETANLDSIGGRFQCAMLTRTGTKLVRAMDSDELGEEWDEMTLKEVRTYQ